MCPAICKIQMSLQYDFYLCSLTARAYKLEVAACISDAETG